MITTYCVICGKVPERPDLICRDRIPIRSDRFSLFLYPLLHVEEKLSLETEQLDPTQCITLCQACHDLVPHGYAKNDQIQLVKDEITRFIQEFCRISGSVPTYRQISTRLNNLQLRSPRGKPFNTNSLYSFMTTHSLDRDQMIPLLPLAMISQAPIQGLNHAPAAPVTSVEGILVPSSPITEEDLDELLQSTVKGDDRGNEL